MSQALSGTSRLSRRQLKLIDCAAESQPVAECEGIAGELSRELESLLVAAGANIVLKTNARPAGGEWHGFLLRQPHGTAAMSPVSLYPVHGLRGVLKGHFPGLSLLVAGISPAAEGAADTLASFAGSVLPAQPRVAAIGCDVLLPALQDRFPGARCLAPEAAVDTLLSASDELDMLVLEDEAARVLSRFATGVSGSRPVAVALSKDAGGLRCGHFSPLQDPVDPAAVVFAAARLLQAIGQGRAAVRLQDAVLKTLEDGIHTHALSTVVPYSTRVYPGRMIAAIGERLGQVPRRLAGARFPELKDKSPSLRRVL